MKKYFAFYTLLFLLLLTSISTIKAQSYRFVIKVISADRHEPIEGASIRFEAKSISHSEQKFETSDWEGTATASLLFTEPFRLMLKHRATTAPFRSW